MSEPVAEQNQSSDELMGGFEDTPEFSKLSVATAFFDAIKDTYGDDVADSEEFKSAIRAAVNSIGSNKASADKLLQLADSLRKKVESTGNIDLDPEEKILSARGRVAAELRAVGLNDQADLFLRQATGTQ